MRSSGKSDVGDLVGSDCRIPGTLVRVLVNGFLTGIRRLVPWTPISRLYG